MLETYLIDTAKRIVKTLDKWNTVIGETTTTFSCRIDWTEKLINKAGELAINSPVNLLVTQAIGGQIQVGDELLVNDEYRIVVQKSNIKDFTTRGWLLYLN